MPESDVEEIVALKREVSDLKRQVSLIVAFLDAETRERQGLTLDEVRAMLRGTPKPPEGHGASPHQGRIGAV